MITTPELVIAVVVLAIFIFVPILRRLLGLIFRIAIFLIGVGVAVAGIAMILNNETIFERPGLAQRVVRFVTMNSAAASSTGSGAVTCDLEQPAAVTTAAASAHYRKHPVKAEGADSQTMPGRLTPATPVPLDDVYPELIRRGFPGIPRQTLFKLSQDTVNALPGWKIVKADSGNFTLDCIYTQRYVNLEDDVKITVDASGEIEVCSRSGLARPGNTSMLRYFPGDLGANVGHIKDFYEALEPKMDEVYKEEQDKQDAKKPPH
jgi:hypothetical protein